jgi:general secretion pathway protein B
VSFILDALRKSESERQRDAPPSPTRIPLAVARAGPPPWVWVVIGALSVAILTIGLAWWFTAERRSSAVPGAAESAPAAQAAAAADPAAPRGETPARPAAPPPQGGRTDVASAPTAAPAPTRFTSPQELPSVAEILAVGVALPPLDLQLISYSEEIASRFVFINGTQYREGQRVQNGPQIVAILPQGVVLSQQGRDFLLSPN